MSSTMKSRVDILCVRRRYSSVDGGTDGNKFELIKTFPILRTHEWVCTSGWSSEGIRSTWKRTRHYSSTLKRYSRVRWEKPFFVSWMSRVVNPFRPATRRRVANIDTWGKVIAVCCFDCWLKHEENAGIWLKPFLRHLADRACLESSERLYSYNACANILRNVLAYLLVR